MLITQWVDMSDRVFTLLILSLALQNVCTGFEVWTLLQNNFNDSNSVNIICQHNVREDWTIKADVFINGQKVCVNDKNNTVCEGIKQGNQFNFTLRMTAEQKGLPCHCRVYRSAPLPIQLREGEKIRLVPGCSPLIPTNHQTNKDVEMGNDYSQSAVTGRLIWLLLGTALLLCFYSLIITVVYIKLRIRISKELQITYVPMQKKCVRPKKGKEHISDKNAEYMYMREVHQQVQPIRDVNHNSRLNPVGSTV
ncbi:uncharacterized protein si:ch211-67e16.3 isoform X2 [Tachysurus fulvidraco]|uniref:uncharacterized protein si:ch211-67e16.3 isoform X2 n=1 Tax=Tachysurus fulvidraco TaxID=1234273 RepID=UPI000F5055C1|nr:uncharacterized protein si:ch211-67e16.3 isoform X2 [Tachysurus fulvidraco]